MGAARRYRSGHLRVPRTSHLDRPVSTGHDNVTGDDMAQQKNHHGRNDKANCHNCNAEVKLPQGSLPGVVDCPECGTRISHRGAFVDPPVVTRIGKTTYL